MSVDPAFAIEVDLLAQTVDELDYYQILKVSQEATLGEVKKAYYKESRAFHPDKYYQLDDEELKLKVNKVYKRITEAYTVLRDAEKRAKYTGDINGPDRATKLRYTEESEAEQKQAREEEMGKTPQARQCYRTALLEMQRGNWLQAERQLKTALMYESDNALFKEKLAEVQQKIKPDPSGGFQIR